MEQDNASARAQALTVGQALRLDMDRLKISSQSDLAKFLGGVVSQQAISEWVNKDRVPENRIALLAEKLGPESALVALARRRGRRYTVTLSPEMRNIPAEQPGVRRKIMFKHQDEEPHDWLPDADERADAIYWAVGFDEPDRHLAVPGTSDDAWSRIAARLPKQLQQYVDRRVPAVAGTRRLDYASSTLFLECIPVSEVESMKLAVLEAIVQLRAAVAPGNAPVRRVCMLVGTTALSAQAVMSPDYTALQDDARAMGVTLLWATSDDYAADFIRIVESQRSP